MNMILTSEIMLYLSKNFKYHHYENHNLPGSIDIIMIFVTS